MCSFALGSLHTPYCVFFKKYVLSEASSSSSSLSSKCGHVSSVPVRRGARIVFLPQNCRNTSAISTKGQNHDLVLAVIQRPPISPPLLSLLSLSCPRQTPVPLVCAGRGPAPRRKLQGGRRPEGKGPGVLSTVGPDSGSLPHRPARRAGAALPVLAAVFLRVARGGF